MPSFLTQLQALLVIVNYGVSTRSYAGIFTLNAMEALMTPAAASYLANVQAALTYILTPPNTKRFNPDFVKEMQDVLGQSTPTITSIFEELKVDSPQTWTSAQMQLNTLIDEATDVYQGLNDHQMWGWAGPGAGA